VAEPTVQVPVSLLERAAKALLEVPPSSVNASIYSDLQDVLAPPTPTPAPVQSNGHNGLAVFADAARRLSELARVDLEPIVKHVYLDGRFGDDGVCHAVVRDAYPSRCYRPRGDTVHTKET